MDELLGGLTVRHAVAGDIPAIVRFLDENWGEPHPLVHVPEFFEFYYRPFGESAPPQFILAEQNGTVAAVAGYIRANERPAPDVWVSIWCASKAVSGSGIDVLNALPRLSGARYAACNNIRPKVRGMYKFLGYDAARMDHFYRLADRETYAVAHVAHKDILPAGGGASLRALPDEAALFASGYAPCEARRPYKDLWYLARRYYRFPFQKYDVWGVLDEADANGGEKSEMITALLVTRTIPANGTCVLRIADYTGEPASFARLGTAIDRLMKETGAEYADCYCAGVPAAAMAAAGFSERAPHDDNIIPNYLAPLRAENTDYYYAAQPDAHFAMFKADGDQDRPFLLSRGV